MQPVPLAKNAAFVNGIAAFAKRTAWANVLASLILFCATQWCRAQSLDLFNPGADGPIYALAIQPDGKILVGGDFQILGGQPRSHIGRINADGTLDASFNPGADGVVSCLAVTEEKNILVGGNFTTLAGIARSHFGGLSPDGGLDMSFNPGVNSNVNCIALEPGGRILIGGSFTNVAGQPRGCIARLNKDGTLDMGFSGEVGGPVEGPPLVFTIALESDGSVLVGGEFEEIDGQSRYAIGRLHGDGTLDTNFNVLAAWFIAAFAVRSDGQILAAGGFDWLNREQRPAIAVLNRDGTLDETFKPEPAFVPYYPIFATIGAQANSKVLVGALTDGKGSVISNPPPFLYEYGSKGKLDTNFSVAANTEIQSIAIQEDGKIIAGGFFTALAGQSRSHIGRLYNSEPSFRWLISDNSKVSWLRGGSSPDLWRTSFSWSTNGVDWIDLGPGTFLSGIWQISPVNVPANATIRARGFVTGGFMNGSTWFVEDFLGPQSQPIISNDIDFGFRSNKFGFNIHASIGRFVVVEASTNMTAWTSLVTNLMSNSSMYFSDVEAPNYQGRYYRVRSQ
jgi:uncharacterized delta-60 repeat protein